MKVSRKERIKNFLGPYDLNVGLIYFTFLVLNIFQLRPETYRYAYGYPRIHFFLSSVFIVLVLSTPLLLLLLASKKVWSKRQKSFFLYFVEVSILTLIVNSTQQIGSGYLVSLFGLKDFLRTDNFWFTNLIKTLVAFLIISFTHSREKELKKRIITVNLLNTLLSNRYRTLIDADEKIRDQAAKLLHDRIQSELMLASSRLGRMTNSLPASMAEEFQSIQKTLEKIRKSDIREVSQLLTPNLDSEGLIGSCENLASDFGVGVTIHININEDMENLDKNLKLGIYRIIEQGINNAIKHGPASQIIVNLFPGDLGVIVLEVIDNGPGATEDNVGTGTIVIDSWVSLLSATKQIESTIGVGYTLRVTIPYTR